MSFIRRLFGWGAPRREAAGQPPAPPPAPPAAIPVLALGEAPVVAPLLGDTPAGRAAVAGDPPGWWRGGVSAETLELSKAFEGLSLVPYDDNGDLPGETWTIGYGSIRDLAGRPVTPLTPPITMTDAILLKRRDLAVAEERARRAFPDGLPSRWGAVAILTSNNLGFMPVWGATLHRLLTQHEWRAAAEQLRHYRNQRQGENGPLVPVLGLRRRRWAEAAYTLGADAGEARRIAWTTISHVDDWPKLRG
jgi:lysozyme